MFVESQKVNGMGLGKGVMASVLMTFKFSLLIVTGYLLFAFMANKNVSITILDIVLIYFIYLLYSVAVTVVLSIFTGIPATFLMVKLGLDSGIISAIMGFLITVTLFLSYIGTYVSEAFFFGCYGALCGWAFMNGYHRGTGHEQN